MGHRIITIDGPAGAGKTSVSKLLAEKLGCVYVDTGALYRAVAYEILARDIDWKDDQTLGLFLEDLDIGFEMAGQSPVLVSSGKDISGAIRTSEISMLASFTSALPMVRAALLATQQQIARQQDAVFEGRDMGTVVFPRANVKFFLFADLAVRALRRFEETHDLKKDVATIQNEMETRDYNDTNRAEAPLKPAKDAFKIDSSFLTIQEVVGKMLTIIHKKKGSIMSK